MEHDIHISYDSHPIIIICDEDQEVAIKKLLMSNKYRYLCGVREDVIHEIRNWDYGILLLLKKHSRGIDTKFQKDAKVLITAKVDNYQQYLQMLGRSSRTRNIC